MRHAATDDGYNIIITCFEATGYREGALNRMLLARRRYVFLGTQTQTDAATFLRTEKMALADAVKSGVAIDDRRADLLIRRR